MAQWIGTHLPVQGTWVWSLVQEDPTGKGAAKPVYHNYWDHMPQLRKPMHPELCSAQRQTKATRSPGTVTREQPLLATTRKELAHQQRLSTAKKQRCAGTLSHVWLCHHVDCSPPDSSVKFSRQGFWSGLPFPPPGDLPDPGIEPSPALAGRFVTTALPRKPKINK